MMSQAHLSAICILAALLFACGSESVSDQATPAVEVDVAPEAAAEPTEVSSTAPVEIEEITEEATEAAEEGSDAIATGIDPSQGAEPATIPEGGVIAPPNPEGPPGRELPATP